MSSTKTMVLTAAWMAAVFFGGCQSQESASGPETQSVANADHSPGAAKTKTDATANMSDVAGESVTDAGSESAADAAAAEETAKVAAAEANSTDSDPSAEEPSEPKLNDDPAANSTEASESPSEKPAGDADEVTPGKPAADEEVSLAPPAGRPDGKTYNITFDDLKLDMPPDTKFKPKMLTDRVKELNGQQVSLKGFIFEGGIFQQSGIRQFLLVMNKECKFGPGGEAYCVIPVELKEGREIDFTIRPITVEGVISIEPFQGPDGNTWAVYRIEGDRAKL